MQSTDSGNMILVRRRQFMLAAAGLLFEPIYALAQKGTKPYRVGVFASGSPKDLQRSLNELGYVEGRDVVFEIRNPEGRSELFDSFALDLVRLKVDVIVAANPNAVLSAKRATTTIPIVMMHTPDPVQLGFVTSLARPGGNITGVTTLSADRASNSSNSSKKPSRERRGSRSCGILTIHGIQRPSRRSRVAVTRRGFSFRFWKCGVPTTSAVCSKR